MKLHYFLTIASATLTLATADADLQKQWEASELHECDDHPLGWGNFWGYGDYLPAWLPF